MSGSDRKLGEVVFAALLTCASAVLMYFAYGISGFEALSAPGSFPIAVSAIMFISGLVILVQTFRIKELTELTTLKDLLPASVVVMLVLITAYAFLLQPLGFLPTSFLFLLVAIKVLFKRGILTSTVISVGCLAIIYIVFRLVFSVLMPEGIVPEREILAWFGSLLSGGTD